MTAVHLEVSNASRRLIDLTAMRGWFRNEQGEVPLQVSQVDGGAWRVTAKTDDSGVAWIPWGPSVDQATATPTCSLQPRDRPYLLATELARGACSRLRALLGPAEAAGSPDASDARSKLRRAALACTDLAEAQGAAEESLDAFRRTP